MKKFLIIFGTFILFIISIGTMFKLLHWPGAGPLLVIGMTFFSVFFLPFFFIQRMIQNKSALNIITNIFSLFSTSILFTGVLFKVMHWPGAGLMIVFGATIFIIPTLILYAIQQFKEYDKKFSEFWRTITLGILASVFLIFWGLNVSRNILYSYLKVEDATLETNKNLIEYNNFIIKEIKQKHVSDTIYSTTVENIHNQTMEMIKYVENIKKQLIQYVEMNPDAMENHWLINAKDNYDIPTHYIGTSESQIGTDLFNSLKDYKTELKNQMQQLPFADKFIIDSLGDYCIKTELKSEMTEGIDMKWNEAMFNQQIIVGALSLLSSIQNEILNAEFKCLKTISIYGSKFNIGIKVSMLGADSTDAIIKITKMGVPYRTINSEGIKYPVSLDLNTNYLVECSKENYTSKIIFFDTHVPSGREKEEFAKFTVEVELHKKVKGEIINPTKPIGGVKYDPQSDDFQKAKTL